MTWKPRRATFSVRIERFSTSTLTRWATVAATNRASRLFWSWVSSKANTMAVKGERVTPADRPGQPEQCPYPGRRAGQDVTDDAADGRPHHHDGGQNAAAGPAAERTGPDDELDDEQKEKRIDGELAEQLGVDRVVADTECPRIDEASDSDEHAADHGPPHPVQVPGELLEEILEAVDGLGHDPGAETGGDPDGGGPEQDHAAERGVMRDREEWLR